MPKDKDLKRLIRARMDKTGESYTTARAHIRARRSPPPAKFAERARVSEAAVKKATGRTWADWVGALDKAEAITMPHGEIARWVEDQGGVSAWWAQQVTVGYERIRGLREVGQRRHGTAAGTFDANKSRTYPVALERLYRAFARKDQRERWLDVRFRVRTSQSNRSIRAEMASGERFNLWFIRKGPEKSTVAVQQERLATAKERDEAKLRWHARLDALGEHLRGRRGRAG